MLRYLGDSSICFEPNAIVSNSVEGKKDLKFFG